MAAIAVQRFGTKGKTYYLLFANCKVRNIEWQHKALFQTYAQKSRTNSLKRYWVLTFELINIFVRY